MNFRRFCKDDLDVVTGIFRSNIPKYFAPDEESGLQSFLATNQAAQYYLGALDGEIVACGGIALNRGDKPTVSLCWGMVLADRLGTGLGKKLTEFRIQKAREKFGELPIVISTSQHTQGFYEKLGFRLIKHEKDGFGAGIDICDMRLDPPKKAVES